MTTKIKARNMYIVRNNNGQFITEREGPLIGEPVFVLDASRYQDLVEQMAQAMHKAYTTGEPWNFTLVSQKNEYKKLARAALRSIGITKSK